MSVLSDAWARLKAFAEAAVKTIEHTVSDIFTKFVPVLEQDFEQFVRDHGADAVASVMAWAAKEVSGPEKLSGVVTDLIQLAESKGREYTADLKVIAQTVAQQAYTAVATSLPKQQS